ncbi:hypothetical protein F3K02_03305 [Hydrogenophaga sp. D2P1]|uniref:Uncharacterized protein n=1 Tax=Hydrogenophaga aromaticivorans TaxID=2610898 RepID=A0A7Y8GSX6_9BURK|nr:hypothetical protein [Hydrogenophaga aromaticivorans]NWF44284.1 hypothetical protein [Hydrogenophaga aromaticivorans]
MTDVLPIAGADALLLDEFGDELLGSGLINSLGLVSALLLVQEQSAQGFPTLSPAKLALDALSMDLLNLEPALASLSSSVPAGLLSSLEGEAEALPWSDLLGQAQTLVNELVAGVSSQDGLPLEALGLESLTTLLDDLQVLDAQLPDALDITSLAGVSGVLAGLTDGQLPLNALDGLVPHAAEMASPVLDQESGLGVVDVLTSTVSGGVPGVSTESPVVNAPETLAPVTAPVQEVVAGVLPPVENLVGLVPGVVAPVVDGVVEVLDQTTDVVETVVGAVDGVTDLLGNVVEDLLTSPGDLPETLVDGVEQVVGVVEDVVGETTELVGDVVDVVGEVVTGTVDNLLDALGSTGGLGDAGGLLEPVTDLLSGGGLGDAGGLLEPMTDLLSGGGLGDAGSLLEPVTDLLSGGGLGDAGSLLEPVTDLLSGGGLGDAGSLLEPVTDLLSGGGLGDAGSLLEPVTDLLSGGVDASLIDTLSGVVEQPQSLLDGLTDLGSVTDVVTDLASDLPVVGDVVSELPLVSDLTGGTLPLVQAPTDEEGGALLGGLLG